MEMNVLMDYIFLFLNEIWPQLTDETHWNMRLAGRQRRPNRIGKD